MSEVGGPIDPDNEAHGLIMSVFGGSLQRRTEPDRNEGQHAMAAQAQFEGGSSADDRLAATNSPTPGRTPSRPKLLTANGSILWRSTSPQPQWSAGSSMSSQRAGRDAIAERLTADGIPSPSAHDPSRNPHCCGIAWSKSAIRAILINPRYTGLAGLEPAAKGQSADLRA